ncbi:MAG: DNA primase [Termitinemataceae bacterium]|nr:MAG: DNA primase [Termitinemataceae bacterium]
MPLVSQKTIDEIQNRADIVSVVSEYVRLEQRGVNYWGLCPFHNEKTPSFSVNPDRKSYYCFGCHEGGGIFNFIMKIENLNYPQALILLAKKLGVHVENENGTPGIKKEDEEAIRGRDELSELYRRVAGSFHHILMNTEEGKTALDYVLGRGLSRETVERFKLGWAPDDKYWLHNFLRDKGYSSEFLTKSALFSRKYPRVSFFQARLMFPINDRYGKTVAFGGRTLTEDGPKYLNSSESVIYHKRETLFALDLALPEIRRSKTTYICEGYMDVIALHEAGVFNSAAPLGTAFTAEQARLLRRWTDKVNLFFDTDAAGEAAVEKAILVCRENALSCSVVKPEYAQAFKDPADILKADGNAALAGAVCRVISDSEYLIQKSKTSFLTREAGPRGVINAINFLAPFFASIESAAERELFSRNAALSFGADPKAVFDDLSSGGARSIIKLRTPVKDDSKTIMMNEELFLLCAAAVHFESKVSFFYEIRKGVSINELGSQNAKELYLAMEECIRLGETTLDSLFSKLEEGPLRDFLAEKCAGKEFTDNAETLVSDGIRGVKIKHLERRARAIDVDIRLVGDDSHKISELLLEKQFLIDEITNLKTLAGSKNES